MTNDSDNPECDPSASRRCSKPISAPSAIKQASTNVTQNRSPSCRSGAKRRVSQVIALYRQLGVESCVQLTAPDRIATRYDAATSIELRRMGALLPPLD